MKVWRWGAAILLPASILARHPAEGTPSRDADLAFLAFMAGCWEGTFEAEGGRSGTIEEHYTRPSTNLMLGTTRYLLDGRTVMFEFSKIEAKDDEILLTPFPRGEPSEHAFAMTGSEDATAVFEAPEHDFPKRITYRKDGSSLVARIDDGGDGSEARASEWRMEAASCD